MNTILQLFRVFILLLNNAQFPQEMEYIMLREKRREGKEQIC